MRQNRAGDRRPNSKLRFSFDPAESSWVCLADLAAEEDDLGPRPSGDRQDPSSVAGRFPAPTEDSGARGPATVGSEVGRDEGPPGAPKWEPASAESATRYPETGPPNTGGKRSPMSPWIQKLRTYGRLVKFSHTVFALPFALSAVLLAHREHPLTGSVVLWVLLAMAGARSAAMGFNRLVDYEYDRLNPRTSDRPLTSGQIDRSSVKMFIAGSSLLFILSATALGKLCFLLAFPTLAILFAYSYTKRFTPYSHFFLGLAIGLAPLGAWVAVSGALDPRILLLSLALLTYIAGFDLLYACQDIDFDRTNRLFSYPASYGVRRTLRLSSALHCITFVLLTALYFAFDLGIPYLGFLVLIGFLLALEHRLVRPDRLDRINLAFFHVNSLVSILLFLAVWTDLWLGARG